MKKPRPQSPGVSLGFQIAPMIDVVFVVMLFFMVMAGQVKVENRLNTHLPSDGIPPIVTPDEIAIRIDDDGQVYLNDDPVDAPESTGLPELTGMLTQLHDASLATKSDVLVTIYAADTAKYGRIVDALDALTVASIGNVTFQAAPVE